MHDLLRIKGEVRGWGEGSAGRGGVKNNGIESAGAY